MIDNSEKAELLMAAIKKALPLQTNITRYLKNALAEKSPELSVPAQCNIVNVIYSGDMGGILCHLSFDGANEKTPVIVSITHLTFDRHIPLARMIESYQKHRIKKLKQQAG